MTARLICVLAATVLIGSPTLRAQDGPPRDNPYDVIGRMLAPFMPVLLSGGKGTNNACVMTLTMTEVTGHLPKQMEGSILRAAVEFPDKVRLQAPVLGEEITVCRNGNDVWAVPGAKVEYLLKQFKVKPGKTVKKGTPIFLPLTAQQAAFIPALFTIYNADTAEISNLDGVDCRLITAGLMPDLAKAAKAEGFRAQLWIAPGYLPRRITIKQPDLSATVTITDLKFGPALQPAMWQPPAGVTDIYHTDADHLDGVLFVIMNSLKTKDIAPTAAPAPGDTPAVQ